MPCGDLVGHITHGVHADAANTNQNPLIVSKLMDESHVRNGFAGGAYFFFRINGTQIVTQLAAQEAARAKARERGFQVVVIFNPFASVAGTVADTANFLAGVDLMLATLINEGDVIFLLGNLNTNTWAGTDAEWWTLEAAGILRIQTAGRPWGAHTDKGIAADMADLSARATAWAAAGVTVANCRMIGSHEYILSGFVPVHVLLAQDSKGRLAVTIPAVAAIPLVLVEVAWDFVHSNAAPPLNTRRGRPDLFDETNSALTWTRRFIAWCRHHGIRFGIFDAPMLFLSGGRLSNWGKIMTDESRRQPAWVEPSAAVALATGGYDAGSAASKAFNLANGNGGGAAAGNAAAARVAAGFLFSR